MALVTIGGVELPPAWVAEAGDAVAGLGTWAVAALRIAGILLAAWLLSRLLVRVLRLARERLQARLDHREAQQRAETLGCVGRYVVHVVVWALALMLVLDQVGVSLAPILGAAGVVGVAVGFGAQSLVKDFFSGFFLLLENQIRVGDVVTAGGHSGLVEEITLRYVRLRDYDGNVHFVPNGRIEDVVNMSRGFAYAVVDVGVAYRENLDRVIEVMQRVAAAQKADAAWAARILADFELAGVERWEASAIVVRGRFQVAPLAQWDVRREYLKRLKAAFDAEGIEIPFPQRTLHLAASAGAAVAAGPLREWPHERRHPDGPAEPAAERGAARPGRAQPAAAGLAGAASAR